MSSEKLKVLLVPADFYHAEGNIALNLKDNCKDIDFVLFAAHDIPKRFEEFTSLLEKVDVVHFLMNLCNINFPDGIDLDHFLKNLPCASVSTVHHICIGEEIKFLEARKLNKIHVVSEEWQNIIKKDYNEDTILAQLGVDVKKFSENITKRPRKVFRIGMFGFFGELKNRKRFDVFIEGLSILKSKNFPFEVILQGQLAPKIKEELKRKEIPYKYNGILDSENAYKAYKNIDCYVIAADVEGGPFSTLESLASGVPLITTKVGMSLEIIRHNHNGIFIEKNNPEEIAEAVIKLGTDQKFYDKLVKNGIKDAEKFDWSVLGKKYKQLYEETLKLNVKGDYVKKIKPKYNTTSINKEVLQRDLLRESAFLYRFNNYQGSAKLFLKAVVSGYSDFGAYKDYLRKLIIK